MNDEDFQRFMEQWGMMLSEVFKLELNLNYQYAPGFDGNAYGQGRNPNYSGQAPKSAFGSGALSNSITSSWSEGTGPLEISMNDYGAVVDQGVKPQPQYLSGKGSGGNSPFITALEDWARRKGFRDPLGAAFGIRRNIWKYGIQPTGFYGNSIDKINRLMSEVFPEKSEELIEEFLDNTLLNLIET
mgnify:CR=1 FL=1